jgi:hypothetical protein
MVLNVLKLAHFRINNYFQWYLHQIMYVNKCVFIFTVHGSTSQHLAAPEAEEYACCLESTDKWFAAWFKVEIELPKEFLDTGISQIHGSFIPVPC